MNQVSRNLPNGPIENLCISPWIHLHVSPNAQVYSCCMAFSEASFSHWKKQTLGELINSPSFKQLRLDMLQNKVSPNCNKCFQIEKSGMLSLRNYLNKYFAHSFSKVLETKDDGTIDSFQMSYVDIRFSNICNFKCRTCGPELSSSWFEDEKAINPQYPFRKLTTLLESSSQFWDQFETFVENVEEINFAGGEPMLMEEHWKILKELTDQQKFDVRIKYNTNLSTLTYKDNFGPELWTPFKNVTMKISLDDIDSRAEYLRKGTRWNVVIENIKKLKEICPQVQIELNCTVSAFNVFYIVELCEKFLQLAQALPKKIQLNLLLYPSYYQASVLPLELKEEIKKKYNRYIIQLKKEFNDEDCYPLISKLESVLKFVAQAEPEAGLELFFKKIAELDDIRNERFENVYPEMMPYLESETTR